MEEAIREKSRGKKMEAQKRGKRQEEAIRKREVAVVCSKRGKEQDGEDRK